MQWIIIKGMRVSKITKIIKESKEYNKALRTFTKAIMNNPEFLEIYEFCRDDIRHVRLNESLSSNPNVAQYNRLFKIKEQWNKQPKMLDHKFEDIGFLYNK